MCLLFVRDFVSDLSMNWLGCIQIFLGTWRSQSLQLSEMASPPGIPTSYYILYGHSPTSITSDNPLIWQDHSKSPRVLVTAHLLSKKTRYFSCSFNPYIPALFHIKSSHEPMVKQLQHRCPRYGGHQDDDANGSCWRSLESILRSTKSAGRLQARSATNKHSTPGQENVGLLENPHVKCFIEGYFLLPDHV